MFLLRKSRAVAKKAHRWPWGSSICDECIELRNNGVRSFRPTRLKGVEYFVRAKAAEFRMLG